jgi:predicted extracellular nuclease
LTHRIRRSRLRLALISVGATTSLVLTPLPQVFAATADPAGATGAEATGAAASTTAVISEVYGGGGNSGATLTRDFVELGNAGTAGYDLAGHSVQYLPGSPSSGSRWQATALTGSIAPDGRYLVGQGTGNGGTVQLPAPDAEGSIAMAGVSGTVALVAGIEALTCKTAADCAADERIVDLVGYGSAVVREGSGPAAGTSNTTSAFRADTLADTDDNAADFGSGAPSPRNAAGEGPQEEEPEEPEEPEAARIHALQGTTRVSPLAGQRVEVPGIVTGVREAGSRGYWIQDAEGDGDPRTSEGVFVYTGSAAITVAVGDSVLVTGEAGEYTPASGAQSVTQLTNATAQVLSSGNALPAPVTLDAGSVPDAYAPEAGGGSINGLTLDPAAYALDLYESVEGMRVEVSDVRLTGRSTDYDELWITVKPEENPTPRGGTVYGSYEEPNTGRLKVMTLGSDPLPAANTGDELTGATTGPMDYASFGGYTIQATALGTHRDNGLTRPVTREQHEDELAIATYNVENLDAADPDEKFAALAEGVVGHLASPDILALEEIQDDNGPVNDGTVAADQTLRKLADAIVAAGGPRYDWRVIDPQNNQDGGQPGGNIRNAFLFNAERVSFTDREGGDATTPVEVIEDTDGARLSVSPGRIDPGNSAWSSSRKPLTGEFVFRGETYFLITNHFGSKGGDQSLHGQFQPPNRTSETKRHQQAEAVNAFVQDLLAADAGARIVNLGDFNDFEFSRTMDILTGDGQLHNPLLDLPAGERYTYVYDGNSQSLDHILISPALTDYEYEVLHINAEFAEQASDHDPQIIRIDTGEDDGDGDGDGRHPIQDVIDRLKEKFGEKLQKVIERLEELLRRLSERR